MLAKRIIPCLDVKDGRVVKGINFVNLRDAGDPVEQAAIYDKQGADELVFLDITASFEKRSPMVEVIRRSAEQIFIPLTVGGGIKSLQDIRLLLRSGTDKVSINTAAVRNPSLVKEAVREFGSQCIVVAIDAKRSCRLQATPACRNIKPGQAGYRQQAAGYRQQAAGYRLQAAGYRLQATGSRLQAAGYKPEAKLGGLY